MKHKPYAITPLKAGFVRMCIIKSRPSLTSIGTKVFFVEKMHGGGHEPAVFFPDENHV